MAMTGAILEDSQKTLQENRNRTLAILDRRLREKRQNEQWNSTLASQSYSDIQEERERRKREEAEQKARATRKKLDRESSFLEGFGQGAGATGNPWVGIATGALSAIPGFISGVEHRSEELGQDPFQAFMRTMGDGMLPGLNPVAGLYGDNVREDAYSWSSLIDDPDRFVNSATSSVGGIAGFKAGQDAKKLPQESAGTGITNPSSAEGALSPGNLSMDQQNMGPTPYGQYTSETNATTPSPYSQQMNEVNQYNGDYKLSAPSFAELMGSYRR